MLIRDFEAKYFSLDEVVKVLGLPKRTIRKYIKNNLIEATNFGSQIMVSHEAIIRFVEQQ